MSYEYDRYLQQHRNNVKRGFEWLLTNLPTVLTGQPDASWQIIFDHDSSKNNDDEYLAYDAYFYGNNRSYEVTEEFKRAWLLHIHRNPHHWQYWVLNNDDPNEGEVILDMPYNYIIEMICDWWSFSWKKGNLGEIFNWYDEHSDYIKLSPKTRKTVEDILKQMRNRLGLNALAHHGIKGQKWGVKNGPPYPLDQSNKKALTDDNTRHIIDVERNSLIGPPNGITQLKNKKGGIERNYFDNLGRQIKQISNNGHGNPKNHNYGTHGEHAHDYIYDDGGNLIKRTIRELNEEERKENDDIL